MFKALQKYFIPICLAVLVHVALFGLFFLNFKNQPETPVLIAQPEVIQATSMDESKVIEEVKKLQQRDKDKRQAEKNRQQKLEDKRIAEQKRLEQLQAQQQQQAKHIEQTKQEQQRLDLAKKTNAEQLVALELKKKQEQQKLDVLKQKQLEETKQLEAIALEKKQLEDKRKKEQQRLAALEKKRKQDIEKKKQERIKREKTAKLAAKKKAEQTARLKLEAETRKTMLAEQAAAEAVRQGNVIRTATRVIMRKVERSWIRPPGTQDGLSATIRVKVIPGGSVRDATVIKSSGNSGFDRSAELAVRKASPLPVPSDAEIFNQFRSFTFNFSPS
jgi:colicin import membrane protein